MNAGELSSALARRAVDVAQHLLPHGKRVGAEWKAGNTSGEAGESLSVRLTGTKAGVWRDFAVDDGGDLLDLWAACFGQTLAQAIADAHRWLGVPQEPPMASPTRLYRRPERPHAKRPLAAALDWLHARGLTDATLAAFKVAAEGDVVVLPYLRDGELVNIKRRSITEKKMWQERDSEPCLFGWHLVPAMARSIAITEGEFDAMALHQVGIPALSVNQGAGNHQWIESDWLRLEQFSEIHLCFDADEAGRKGVREVANRLGLERCRIVTFGDHKDANDALLAGYQDWQCALREARTLDPDELVGVEPFIDDVVGEFYPAGDAPLYPMLRIGMDQDWFRFRPQEVTVWTGHNGHGKSMLLGLVQLGLIEQGERFCVFSGEMPPRKLLTRMCRQATGMQEPSIPYLRHCLRWLAQSMWLFNVQGAANSERMLEVFAYAARRYGVTHFIIDSLMMLEDVPEDGKGSLEKQRQFMVRLTAFAKRYGAHVHLVAHPRKADDERRAPGKQDVAGSGKITNMADNHFSVWAALKDEEAPPDDSIDAKLELNKQRNGDTQHRTLYLWFDKRSQQHTISSRRQPRRFGDWEARA